MNLKDKSFKMNASKCPKKKGNVLQVIPFIYALPNY